MGKVRIINIRERTRWITPERSESTLEVTFETEAGIRGTVTGLKPDASEEEIWEAVKEKAKKIERLMGTTVSTEE